ncbi:Cro/CI family transcriptional regulator [Rheinheimera sp. MMS21-TC3]|uniref:Cro/CI family transcriptional regulator n=1 Tax=Rheinheimera sp. MMS21-TC3 TaxID=3072790 RepID=UPI0028C3A3A2|nr:Cro/CI family transcriptional regulator [Rheinheimera sp. MMS21-TC3]WNO60863.1 Cro/CI family transcriptional regulator [Rheinheimera sp. MMS21-TC3]
MKKADVISHFGGVIKTAKALGITSQSISQWPDQIPELRAYQIQHLTGGALKAKQVKQIQQSS